jgi:hypothetical protein
MKKTTYYHLVLDKSGSMDSCWDEAKQVITNQINELARVQSENPESQILFSFCAFNQVPQLSKEITNIQDVLIDWGNIYPDGMTALYDAIGISIAFIKEKAGKDLESIHADVVILILTDGYENASQRYSGQTIKEMIQAHEQTEKWNFLFMAAGLDISDVTSELDRNNRNSFSFAKTEFKKSFELLNDELEDYIKSKSKDQKKKGFF